MLRQGGRRCTNASATGSSCPPSRSKPVVTVAELVELTGASEATIRRDIATLHVQKKLRRVRGGAEAVSPPQFVGLAGRPFSVNQTLHTARSAPSPARRSSCARTASRSSSTAARRPSRWCIRWRRRRLQVFTNSFPIAEHLLKHSQEHRHAVRAARSTASRTSSVSPSSNDVTAISTRARMFMGAQGVGRSALMEADPLLIQAEQKLIGQADELVVLVDSSKFAPPVQPDPVPARADHHGHHRRGHRRRATPRCWRRPASR